MKRLLAALVGLALALVGTVAFAAWLSTGSAQATATATTVAQANQPTAVRGAGQVTLSWAASTLASGDPVGGYRVVRHDGSTTTTTCTVTAPTHTCIDPSPVATAVTYGVIATIGTHWAGPESATTSFTYDDVAPVTTAQVSPAPNGAGWNHGPSDQVTVSLTATDSGSPSSGVDHVSYAIDNGVPVIVNAASADFTVAGAGTHTVDYFAVDKVGRTETSRPLTVRIDPNAPVTTVVRSPAANADGWNSTDVALDFTATDSGTSGVKSVTVDGVATAGSTASKTVTAEGTTTVSYFASDNADNVEGAKSVTVKIDKTAPTASISPTSSSTWIKQASQSVTVDGTDGLSGVASVSYAIDGGSTITTNGTGVTFSVGQGDHTITYFAADRAGNQQAPQSASIRVDNVAPTASISPVSDGSAWRTSTSATITATDATSGAASIAYKVNGAATYTVVSGASASVTGLNQGTNTIAYHAVDNANNSSADASATIKVDTQGPDLSGFDPANGDSGVAWGDIDCATNANQVCVTVTDTTSGVATATYQLTRSTDGKCWNGGSFVTGPCAGQPMAHSGSVYRSTSLTPAAMGVATYTLSVTAADNATNTATASASFTVTGDVTGPAITNIDPSNGKSGNNWNQVDCAAVGGRICANITDSSGIASVTYCLQSVSSSLYWTGNANGFDGASCSPRAMLVSSGSRYVSEGISNSSMPSGSFRLVITATDAAPNANVSVSSTVTFTIN